MEEFYQGVIKKGLKEWDFLQGVLDKLDEVIGDRDRVKDILTLLSRLDTDGLLLIAETFLEYKRRLIIQDEEVKNNLTELMMVDRALLGVTELREFYQRTEQE